MANCGNCDKDIVTFKTKKMLYFGALRCVNTSLALNETSVSTLIGVISFAESQFA